MSQGTWPDSSYAEAADLAGRLEALRQAAALPGADAQALLEAAFAELDAAVEILGKLTEADTGEARADKDARDNGGAAAVRDMARRMDMVTAVGGTGYGVLTLARSATEGYFDIADLGLAEELGEHLGLAIRVDRMFRHRSAVAEALQGSLLPARLPEIPWLELSAAYLPSSEGLEVSGDFYDVFPVAGGWAITVGDVCGKGQEAAATTAAARHAIRVPARWNPDPADVLAKVNEVISAGDYEDRFVTAKLAYLRRDGTSIRVVLASAGHPGPAVIRTDGRVEMMSGGGLPLGLFPDADQQRAELKLGPGDLLFFYSDGVTGARSSDMEYFEDRLADELAGMAGRSAAETARIVQGLVSGFSSGNELRDDMTILVAKVYASRRDLGFSGSPPP